MYVPVNCLYKILQRGPDPVNIITITMKPILETNLAIYFIKCQRGELSTVHFLELHQLNPPPPPALMINIKTEQQATVKDRQGLLFISRSPGLPPTFIIYAVSGNSAESFDKKLIR